MPTVKNVEKRIRDVEGFDVVIKANGKDLRGDKQGLKQYEGERASRNNWTVAEWKKKKFETQYPGLELDVLDGDGNPAGGRRKLGTIRDTYSEE